VVSRSGGRWFWSQDAFPAEPWPLPAGGRQRGDRGHLARSARGHRRDGPISAQVMLTRSDLPPDGAQYHVDGWTGRRRRRTCAVEIDYYTDALFGSPSTCSTRSSTSPARPGPQPRRVKVTPWPPCSRRSASTRTRTSARARSTCRSRHSQHGLLDVHRGRTGGCRWARDDGGRLQGMAHAMRTVASLRLMCDRVTSARWASPVDVHAPAHRHHLRVYPGGVATPGGSTNSIRHMLADAAELVRGCPCVAGCPSCIGPLGGVDGAKEACLLLLSANVLPV